VAWRVAIESRHRPVALVLTRQELPTLDRTRYAAAEGLRRGAYVLADAPANKTDLILIASGSEISLAVGARQKLEDQGISARVVSMPSWELFNAQPQEYRDEVLSPSIRARLAIEAGVAQGWHRYVGDQGDVISLERFGASAPAKVVFEKFGYTVDSLVARSFKLLGK
jgi:transketolase